jgi:DNA-binding FadR family transcriptional regulator
MRVLIGDIVAGTYPEGALLPKEDDLVARFRVSRGTVRECVQRLEGRGLVTVKHGRGAIVRPDREWSRFDRDVVAALLSSPRVGALLGEYLECRRVLEVEAAGLAAERATRRAVDRLSRAFAELRARAEDAQRNAAAEELYREADVGFHREVVEAAGNPTLGQVTEPIHRALSSTFAALGRPHDRYIRGLPEHERILTAIAEHDADAARDAMRAHLLTVEGYLPKQRGRTRHSRGRRAS